ncbi:MAG: AAA family ATPase, partial [Anaerolineales bacterium]
MIPLRLELINFLPYRNPAPLDFTGIHVAVLTGDNGAGKSSLLDAMTWAIWGRARAKTDGELVHQGQSEMRVEFTFALGDQTYRIIRAKRAGKSTGGVLDFQTSTAPGKWISIGEATIPKTQEKIIRVLRLTHDTFVNSAYLMQGKADEFTGKRPTERKQVLADILGLQDWERYEDRAKERIKAIDTRLAGLDAVLKEIETEFARRADYQRELSDARASVIEVAERLRQAEAGWAQIDVARQAMIALERQIEDLSRRIREAEREVATLDADLREARLRADTASIYKELEAAQRRQATLDELEVERERVTEARQQVGELMGQLKGQNEAAKAEG